MEKPEQPPSPRPKPIYMTIATWIIIGTVIAAFLIFKQLNAVKPATAREWLKKGALVIDVRSEVGVPGTASAGRDQHPPRPVGRGNRPGALPTRSNRFCSTA